jgi:hypothetical protein
MSWLSEALKKAGAPASALNAVQAVIDGYKARLMAKIPTAAVLAASVRRQEIYKKALAKVPVASRPYVDGMLETVLEAGLVKLKKELGV